MKCRRILALGLGLIFGAFTLGASAENGAGNAIEGKTLAYTCAGCHGVPTYKNAYPNYSVPKLGGQNPQYLKLALQAYATGERQHQTMHSHAATRSEAELADIAAYFQGEPAQPQEVVGAPPSATQTCVACHGAGGARPIMPEYPLLAGQHADYIVQALREYKSGKRKNPIMAGIIAGVDENDFEAIGQFFANQPGLCSTDQIRKHGKCAAR